MLEKQLKVFFWACSSFAQEWFLFWCTKESITCGSTSARYVDLHPCITTMPGFILELSTALGSMYSASLLRLELALFSSLGRGLVKQLRMRKRKRQRQRQTVLPVRTFDFDLFFGSWDRKPLGRSWREKGRVMYPSSHQSVNHLRLLPKSVRSCFNC